MEAFLQVEAEADAQSDPICSSAGCDQYKHPDLPDEPPRDYFVPNFGKDIDIKNSIQDEKVASKLVGHRWNFKTEDSWEKYRNPAKDVKYNFDQKLDEDMKASLQNEKDAEKLLGNWDFVQTTDDPITSSAGLQ